MTARTTEPRPEPPTPARRRIPVAYVDPETMRERAGGPRSILFAQQRFYRDHADAACMPEPWEPEHWTHRRATA